MFACLLLCVYIMTENNPRFNDYTVQMLSVS